ncbi:hypothetical protein ACOV1W_03735 [Paraclostridium bifermentans]|uniref:hypothetical protein n=1 Tax=Paraclostridium bifermentans TaxID=1490 RepID=UPI003D27DD28
MNFGLEIVNLFVSKSDIKEIKLEENLDGVYINLSCSQVLSPSLTEFEHILEKISARDKLRITISIEGEDDSLVTYSSGGNKNKFLDDINKYVAGEEEYLLKIDIGKVIQDNVISIYDMNKIGEYLDSLNLKNILNKFNKLLNKGKIKLEVLGDGHYNSNSESIFITDKNELNSNNNRENQINKINKVCNFMNSSTCNLTYTDFKFNNKINKNIDNIFKKLEYIFSLIAISDRSELKGDNEIEFTIIGHKSLNFKIDYSCINLNVNTNQYSMICDWIYRKDSGDISDKIGIVRNIISISAKDESILSINSNLLPSIKSSHSIYLRENVEKYLEVKQEVTDGIFDLMKNISSITDTIGKNFKSNMIFIITFFVTIIISNSLNDHRLKNIFTKDITMVSISFIIGSMAFLKMSMNEANSEVKRFETLYRRLKKNYEDVLNEKDIDSLFNESEFLEEDIRFINNKIHIYRNTWIVMIVIMTLLVVLIGSFSNIESTTEPVKTFLLAFLGIR